MVKSVTSIKLRLSPKIKGSINEDLGIESTSFIHEGKEIFEISRIVNIETKLPYCGHSYKFDSMVERLQNKKIDEPMCPNCHQKNELIGPSVKRKPGEMEKEEPIDLTLEKKLSAMNLDKFAREEGKNIWSTKHVRDGKIVIDEFRVMTFNINDLVTHVEIPQLLHLFNLCGHKQIGSIKRDNGNLVFNLEFFKQEKNDYISSVHLEFVQGGNNNHVFSYVKDPKDKIIASFVYTIGSEQLEEQTFPDVEFLMEKDNIEDPGLEDNLYIQWINALNLLLKEIALCNLGVAQSKEIYPVDLKTFTDKLRNELNTFGVDVEELNDLMDIKYNGLSVVEWCMIKANLFKASVFRLQLSDLKHEDEDEDDKPPHIIEARMLVYCIIEKYKFNKATIYGMLRSILQRIDVYGRTIDNVTKKFISFREVELENLIHLDKLGFSKDTARYPSSPYPYVSYNINDDTTFKNTLSEYSEKPLPKTGRKRQKKNK